MRNQLSFNLRQSIQKILKENLWSNKSHLEKIREFVAEKRALINNCQNSNESNQTDKETNEIETEEYA